MAFTAQRLANRYPVWTKIRRDPSSMGQRFFSVFGDGIDESFILAKRLAYDRRLLNVFNGPGLAYVVDLSEDDAIVLASNGTAKTWVYPTVVGDSITLTRYDYLADLLSLAPSRFGTTVIDTATLQVWSSSAPTTYVDLAVEGYLFISVENSENFYRKTARTNVDKSGRHQVVLTGTDQNDVEFVEYLQIPDIGYYQTQNVFKTLTNVFYEGFDGDVTVSLAPVSPDWIQDPMRVLVAFDNEGPLQYKLSNRTYGGDPYAHVVYQTSRIKLGELYRKSGLEDVSNFEEEHELLLLNEAGDSYTATAMCVSPINGKLYVLGSTGYVYIYEPVLPAFLPLSVEETLESYIEIHPETHYTYMGATQKLWTYHARLRHAIGGVRIRRVSPSGTTRYLQVDKATWGASPYTFAGPSSQVPELSWQDFNFDNLYDEIGQWEFYTEVDSGDATTIYGTAVQIAALSPEAEISNGIIDANGAFIDHNGKFCLSRTSNKIYRYPQILDGYVADPESQLLIMAHSYTDIKVSY